MLKYKIMQNAVKETVHRGADIVLGTRLLHFLFAARIAGSRIGAVSSSSAFHFVFAFGSQKSCGTRTVVFLSQLIVTFRLRFEARSTAENNLTVS